MKTETDFVTSNEELLKLVKDGLFFHFCVGFAVNKGFKDAIKEKKEVKFSVGDYNINFEPEHMCFTLIHKTYFARMMTAYFDQVTFIGTDEQEVINDLLIEAEKELLSPSTEQPLK